MIHLTVLNLQSIIFDGQVSSITLPAETGEITILPGHLPIVTPLKKGSISAVAVDAERYEQEERKYFESNGGLLEFSDNEATVLL